MFVREKKNKNGSVSVQIIDKSSGVYKVVKTVGNSSDPDRIEHLKRFGHSFLPELTGQTSLCLESDADNKISAYFNTTDSLRVRVIGPEMMLGMIFDRLGFNSIKEKLFRYLVITRLVYPGSKLKTIDYLDRYNGVALTKDDIYRFLDELSRKYKAQVEDISFQYTKKMAGGKIGIVFYDMTTLYFESEDEDDLRRTGFSKDGKHQNPQIYLGLLVSSEGNPIGYEIFEGNIYEGNTLIPILTAFEKRFNLTKSIIVADAGLLSNNNIEQLVLNGYEYILGARIKNERSDIQKKILSLKLNDNGISEIKKGEDCRLVISYTEHRAKKDQHNRKKGLQKLENNIKRGKLNKSHINNRGYNRYLKLTGTINIEIDYDKFDSDSKWDGLKGYITNTKLPMEGVVDHYKNLWKIERAFRISKTDLRIRPIYHRLRSKIEAHICISFAAYTVYKELERTLCEHKVPFSARRAIELTQTIYVLDYQLPDSKKLKSIILKLSEEQKLLWQIIEKCL